MKILLATDGSAHSKAAVEEVARRPFPLNTKVRIVAVYDRIPLVTAMGPMGVSQEYFAEADLQASKAAEAATEIASKILHKKNPSLTISTIVIQGSPKSIILEEAEKFSADLIVVGSHGYGAVERFLLGSVSQSVALHAKCSVEIVRK
ncbi:MAG: universal stress protein [bacterium]|nr:universal stress protein [bacterium]